MLEKLIRWVDGAKLVAVGEFDGCDEILRYPYTVLLYQGRWSRHVQFVASVWPHKPAAFKGYRFGCAWAKGAPMPHGMAWVRPEVQP